MSRSPSIPFLQKFPVLLLSLALISSSLDDIGGAYAFFPTKSTIYNIHPRFPTQIQSDGSGRSSTKTSSLTPLETNNIASQNRQEVAKDALLKLLEKQRKELQETEDLIQTLNMEKSQSVNKITNNANNQDCDPNENAASISTSKSSPTTTSTLSKSLNSGVDYGFISRSEGCDYDNANSDTTNNSGNEIFQGYGPPANIFSLGRQQFMRNMNAMKGEYKEELSDDKDRIPLTPRQKQLQKDLQKLTLNSTAIWEREEARGEIIAPLIIKAPYYVLCYFLDVVFEGSYVPSRFFLLETVARMPYMSYITMLHLYETLGFWRRSADVKRVHFAEEWNEFHHLLVMESLGGDQKWFVRFLAQHSAIFYFLVLTHLFAISPSLSYKFSELLEGHAVDTYGQFLDENEERLKKLPPSLAAIDYYVLGISDPMFGEYQTGAGASGGEIRKSGKDMTSLYAVFKAIRADEGDHVGTMKACLDPTIPVLSPALETRILTGFALAASVGYFISTGEIPDDLGSTATELLEGADDTMITDTIVDGILGGVAGLFGGLGALQGEAETALEAGSEIEELASSGNLFVPLLNNLRQGLLFILEALRFL